jgi:hypothetical protein
MASEYHHGDMDISEQAATYGGFMVVTKWGSLAIAALLILLVLWFCTPAGFLAGLGVSLALTVVGIVVLREKPDAAH